VGFSLVGKRVRVQALRRIFPSLLRKVRSSNTQLEVVLSPAQVNADFNMSDSEAVISPAQATANSDSVVKEDAMEVPTFVMENIRRIVECPICMNVPRDGVMLMCETDHTICSGCKNKLGRNAKCPQCRRGFLSPPSRNYAVAELIGSFPFTWACRYQTESGCGFEGLAAPLALHEDACRQTRKFPCPNCEEMFLLNAISEHLATAHRTPAKALNSNRSRGKLRFLIFAI
jgi:hypothetical protein